MNVIAPPGHKCPLERNYKKYITAEKAVDVPDTPYYRRLVNEGSLLEVEPAPAKPTPAEKKASAAAAPEGGAQ